MKEIQLTQGYIALVDDEDYARVNKYKWCARVERRKDKSIVKVYALRKVRSATGKSTTQLMHRFILGVTDTSVEVDHNPDNSGLNNQRSNLRLATSAQNSRNRRLSVANSSGFKGVSFCKARGTWESKIETEERTTHLGRYKTSEQAARAYDEAAVRMFGEFAKTNF